MTATKKRTQKKILASYFGRKADFGNMADDVNEANKAHKPYSLPLANNLMLFSLCLIFHLKTPKREVSNDDMGPTRSISSIGT